MIRGGFSTVGIEPDTPEFGFIDRRPLPGDCFLLCWPLKVAAAA